MTLKPGQSGNLDLLRAVAVSSVFLDHFAEAAWHNEGFRMLGRFGVVLFFVHTSCVLMASLQRMESSAASDFSLTAAFWIRRFFRIYPLGVLCVLTVGAFHIPSTPLDSYHWIGLKSFLANLALAQNLSTSPDILAPLWSLPLEVQMYLLLPFAYFVIRGGHYRSLPVWLLALVPSIVFGQIVIHRPFQVFVFMPCFTAGVIAFDLARRPSESFRFPAWIWPVGIISLLAIFGSYDATPFSEHYPRCWMLALGIGVLYPLVKEAQLNWLYKGCRWIAERSYGIYLSHSIVLWVVFNQMRHFPVWLQIPVLISGVLGIPAVLYVTFEKPLIQAGTHIAKGCLRRSRPEVAQAAI